MIIPLCLSDIGYVAFSAPKHIDPNDDENETLQAHVWLNALQRAMKHIFDSEIAAVLKDLQPLLAAMEKHEGGFTFVARL